MANAKNPRGLFERPLGSGVWWINYYADGKQHREKAGRKSDALALYQKRKADTRRGVKLPELVRGNVVTLADLMQDAVDYARVHSQTPDDYEWKRRALVEPFGSRPAAEITPGEIDGWLRSHCKAAATANRFRAFVSLCYRLGLENKKVAANPARLVRARKENNARLRFLTFDEYDALLARIRRDYPEQAPAFVVSIFTGMRWSEQFQMKWSQVDFKRKVVHLSETKDPKGRVITRNVPLNSVAFTAIQEQQQLVAHKPTDRVFPDAGWYCRYWFIPAMKSAGIDDYTWHSNRHTFCSWLAIEGVSLKEIQELSGHKTLSMVARYAHLSPHISAKASERMVLDRFK